MCILFAFILKETSGNYILLNISQHLQYMGCIPYYGNTIILIIGSLLLNIQMPLQFKSLCFWEQFESNSIMQDGGALLTLLPHVNEICLS